MTATGFYNIFMEYLIPESRGVAAERVVYLNGEVPFEDARNISFTRIWTDAGRRTGMVIQVARVSTCPLHAFYVSAQVSARVLLMEVIQKYALNIKNKAKYEENMRNY